jgi:hypothetical protein
VRQPSKRSRACRKCRRHPCLRCRRLRQAPARRHLARLRHQAQQHPVLQQDRRVRRVACPRCRHLARGNLERRRLCGAYRIFPAGAAHLLEAAQRARALHPVQPVRGVT